MKYVIAFFLLINVTAYAQNYEYINVSQVKPGGRVDFDWPSRPDSAKIYTDMKSKSLLLCIQTMEGKGFELVTINEYGPGNLVIIISAYMRRRK